MNLLDLGPLGAVRRNHAIEHATIHILTRMAPDRSMAGRSSNRGFFIYGDLETEWVRSAVEEAIRRIKDGEHYLAIHPNCGTNLITTSVFAATATMLAGVGGRRRHLVDRIPSAFVGALVGVFLGQVVGPVLQQRLTTSAELGEAQVVTVQRHEFGRRSWHWVGMEYLPHELNLPS